MRLYQHKPPHASDGKAFEKLCLFLYESLLGQVLHECRDVRAQIEIGDTYEGHEWKELKKSETRLHIEIAENNDRVNWFSSGIYAPNRKWYVCGNTEDIWCFKVEDLIEYHRMRAPMEIWYGYDPVLQIYRLGNPKDPILQATIHSFILHKNDAHKVFVHRFYRDGEIWRVLRPPPLQYEMFPVFR